MKKKMKIEKPSYKLFTEAIRDLDVLPAYFDIEMLADGILYPKYKDETDKKRYLSECEEKRVVPYTVIKLVYDISFKLRFVPPVFTDPVIRSRKKEDIERLIKGGRIHKINFEAKAPAFEGFEFFRDEFLDTMLKNGYQPYEGELILNYFLDHESDRISFGMDGFNRGLELELQSDKLSKEELREVLVWFSLLKRKYENKKLV